MNGPPNGPGAQAAGPPTPRDVRGPRPTSDAGSSDPRVEDALSRLAELDSLPLAEQVSVFHDIHQRLGAVLADPDSQA